MYNTLAIKKFTFNDIDDFSSSIAHGSIESKQLEAGKYKSRISLIGSNNVLISHLTSNRTILQQGSAVAGFTTILIPGNLEQNFYWRKQRLAGNRFGILKGTMEHRSVILSNFFAFAISIRNHHLLSISQSIGYPGFYEKINKKEIVVVDIESAKIIHSNLVSFFRNEFSDNDLLEFNIPSLIIQAIANSNGFRLDEEAPIHGLYFKKALDFINENIYHSIDIPKLSTEVGVSERNLRYIFNGQAGTSPKKFIHNLKLNYVRKLIKSTDSNEQNVGHLANQFGFWHTGQFAADYFKLFGELPSETLTK